MKIRAVIMPILWCAAFTLSAATPPALINYQGVLRDGSGAPRTGSFDMVFRFYSASAAGTLLLTDTHNAAAPSGQVSVANGLFTTQLGAGTIEAGSEPNLAETFRDNAAVWLETQVGTETLAPRVRVLASAYTQNARTLEGYEANAFAPAGHMQTPSAGGTGLDTSATPPGNLLYTSSAGTWATLPTGSPGQLLQTTGPEIQWVEPSAVSDGDWTINGNDLVTAVSGNVGIGTTTPSSKLSVNGSLDVGVWTGVAQDQSQLAMNGYMESTSWWQSFTPSIAGTLTQWSQNLQVTPGRSGTLTIYEGEGVAGRLLASQSIVLPAGGGWYDFAIAEPPELKPGQLYTVQIQTPSGSSGIWAKNFNPYPAGKYNGSWDWDAAFITTMNGIAWTLGVTGAGQLGIGTKAPSATLDVEGSVHMLGARQTINPDTTYLAESDGLVMALIMFAADGDRGCIHGVTTNNFTASACIHRYVPSGTIIPRNSLTLPVRKGESYRVTRDITWGNPTTAVFWIPLGHESGGAKAAEAANPTPGSANRSSAPGTPGGEAGAKAGIVGGRCCPEGPNTALIHLLSCDPGTEPGDVVVMDAAGGGSLDRCARVADPMVVGVVEGDKLGVQDPELREAMGGARLPSSDFRLPVVVAGVTTVKADAAQAPIARGDLLTTSANPGHAQKAVEPRPGTIVGKALEDLADGTGLIRVLVLSR